MSVILEPPSVALVTYIFFYTTDPKLCLSGVIIKRETYHLKVAIM